MIEAKSVLRKSLLTKSLVKLTSVCEEPDYCHTVSSKTGDLSQRMCASAVCVGLCLRWYHGLPPTIAQSMLFRRAKQHDKLLALLTFSS